MATCQGIGTDIIEIDRIARAMEHHPEKFLNKIFTQKEQKYCLGFKESAARFAGRFAAKEAVVKALGVGFREGVTWTDIEIQGDEEGVPRVHFSEGLLERYDEPPSIQLSISHCKSYATAVAIWME